METEMATAEANLDVFQHHRGQLFGAAYRLLGSVADAEDVLQEAWLRFADVPMDEVREPRAYLLRTVTNLALNQIRTQQRRREEYIGPWLPEPVGAVPRTAAAAAPDDAAVLADDVSMAMLIVLEQLTPLERAAYILSDVFGYQAPEIGRTLDRSPAAVRQLISRARAHVSSGRARNQVDPALHRRITEQFLLAASTGVFEPLLGLLAPEVVLTSDGGGQKSAALRPIVGAEKVLRFLLGVTSKPDTPFQLRIAEVNGLAALIAVDSSGAVDTVASFRIEASLVREIFIVRNPDKLRHIHA
ncbi:ECF subfamily RNA polymerase sigma-24 subunit [Arthrobacter crystallopoietes BAB-32]|uniref:ECF subfamily RNA polymerase sigma-24 subunit n=1 Tax=Arthrobacter crystallopoietes BAB-32 TaxID=1246476 RepID=N1UV53_9MICC|nr:RNA polymerase sigma factor SigJ [Arthrobacter crystallopoietes]EMY32930.1 ECF subfamily RNA polymerase sigma-24 subunit [Arthrobacter crystallopoietes BAB-32]